MTYEKAGVDVHREPEALRRLAEVLYPTKGFLSFGEVLVGIGYFAAVVKVSEEMAIAVSTDGVGTKLLIAQMVGNYETVGIDCVAMNVNDILCVGATPLFFVDYLAVEKLDADMVVQIAKGLAEGARQAGVAVVGGELAQLKEMVRGAAEGKGFDLAGTCLGIVSPERFIVGQNLREGDVVIGLSSDGIHSNGLTLARRILFDRMGWEPTKFVDDLGCTIAEELLKPTRIYVRSVLALLKEEVAVKALVHITGGGFRNLLRVQTPCTFVLDNLPEPPPLFLLIQRFGDVPTEEMVTTFNMGVGFCVVVARRDADEAVAILRGNGERAQVIGQVTGLGRSRVSLSRYGVILSPV